MTEERKIPLLPCPFCGKDDYLEFSEWQLTPKTLFDKLGRVRERCNVQHRVWCGNCGAEGAHSFCRRDDDVLLITDDIVAESQLAAATLWNTRAPINDRAFALINEIITVIHAEMGKK